MFCTRFQNRIFLEFCVRVSSRSNIKPFEFRGSTVRVYSDLMLLVNNLHGRIHVSKLDKGLLCNCNQVFRSLMEGKVFRYKTHKTV
jgi:hypothetical protein